MNFIITKTIYNKYFVPYWHPKTKIFIWKLNPTKIFGGKIFASFGEALDSLENIKIAKRSKFAICDFTIDSQNIVYLLNCSFNKNDLKNQIFVKVNEIIWTDPNSLCDYFGYEL